MLFLSLHLCVLSRFKQTFCDLALPFSLYFNHVFMSSSITIRRASVSDIPRLGELLVQVCNVHAAGRPDIFVAGHRKYSDHELRLLINQFPLSPILVAANENDVCVGYAFCQIQNHEATDNTRDRRTLYLDDLCVDEACRGQHVGKRLYEAVCQLAKEEQCQAVTLNVWACNPSAVGFYESLGLRTLKTTLEQCLD